MDKKKLARLLGLIGGILLIVTVLLWFIPVVPYTYTDKVAGEISTSISPLGYFAEAGATYGHFKKAVMDVKIEDYNTNMDMYWIIFGFIFAIANILFTGFKGRKLFTKTLGVIFSAFVVVGLIASPFFHMCGAMWVVYLVLAILALVAYIGAWVVDYMFG